MDISFYISKPSTTCSRGEEKLRANTKKKKPLTLSSLKRNHSPPLIFQKKKTKQAPPLLFEKKETRDLSLATRCPLSLSSTQTFLVHPLLSLSAIRQPPHTPFSCHSPISWLHETFPPSAVNLTSPYLSVT
jgi:hypothetical protein